MASVVGRYSILAAFALAACQPALNWREVRLPGAGVGMMPCKPDASRRQVPLGGHAVEIQLLTCNAAGATFALAFARVPAGASPQLAQQHWQRSTLAHLKAREVLESAGATALNGATGLTAAGVRPENGTMGANGRAIAVATYWFTQGQQLVHAAVYVDNLSGKPVAQLLTAELQEPFFGGVRIQP